MLKLASHVAKGRLTSGQRNNNYAILSIDNLFVYKKQKLKKNKQIKLIWKYVAGDGPYKVTVCHASKATEPITPDFVPGCFSFAPHTKSKVVNMLNPLSLWIKCGKKS